MLFSSNISFAEFIDEALPTMNKDVNQFSSKMISLKKYDLDFLKMVEFFNSIDERGKETDARYVILKISKDGIHYSIKGTGTVLYSNGNHILLITAKHNLYDDFGNPYKKINVVLDGRDVSDLIIAQNNDVNNYVFVKDKDIALSLATLKSSTKDTYEKNTDLFKIKYLKDISYPGSSYLSKVVIQQYPSYANRYFKTSGDAYYDDVSGKFVGYHHIPTLAGSSGSSLIYRHCFYYFFFCDNFESIVGIHSSAGNDDTSVTKQIIHSKRELLKKNNIFELISKQEIEDLDFTGKNKDLEQIVKDYLFHLDKDDL